MLLDFLATNNWKRPLYFANPSTVEDFMEIDQYCHLEGLVYKFMPVLAGDRIQGLGGITSSQPTYDILMNNAGGVISTIRGLLLTGKATAT